MGESTYIDFADPFLLLDSTYLIVVDSYSKWPKVFVMPTTNSEKTIEVLRNIFCRYGLPHCVVSDNGPQFASTEFQTFIKSNGIMHKLSAPATSVKSMGCV